LSVPSVNAAAALAKYAYKPTAVRPGFRTQDVLAMMLELPGLVLLPATSAKFTEFAESVIVIDSCKLALRVIACAAELYCADASEVAKIIASATRATRIRVLLFIVPPQSGASAALLLLFPSQGNA